MNFRKTLFAVAALTFASVAAAFPTKTITIVVPVAAGGGNDAMARLVAQRLSVVIGQPVIVENKAGASGAIASEYVARAPADGYTLLFGYTATHAINPVLQKLRYDPVNDFEPVGLVSESPTLLVVHPSVKAKTAKDLVALLKAKGNDFSYASAGNGTAPHLAAELFKMATAAPMVHVPYKGAAPAMMDTIAGTTQIMFPSLFAGSPQVKAGKLVALGIAGPKRVPNMPGVPTLTEQGIDVDVTQWYGLFAPAKTPNEVIERLNTELNKVLASPELIAKMGEQGADVVSSTPAQFKARVVSEIAKWKKVVAASGIVAD